MSGDDSRFNGLSPWAKPLKWLNFDFASLQVYGNALTMGIIYPCPLLKEHDPGTKKSCPGDKRPLPFAPWIFDGLRA
jgi:hypothetical protein